MLRSLLGQSQTGGKGGGGPGWVAEGDSDDNGDATSLV